MAVSVSTKIEIERPISVVAGFAENPDNAPLWYKNIESVEWVGPAVVQIGAQVKFVAHFLGKRLAYTYEIVEHVPGSKMKMRTAEGPFPMETTYVWEEVKDDGTRMTLINEGNPQGFAKLSAPFMSGAMRRANEKDLLSIKRILESRT